MVEDLDYLDQQMFLEILSKRLNEKRRNEILKNAEVTFQAIENGTAKSGNLNELLKIWRSNVRFFWEGSFLRAFKEQPRTSPCLNLRLPIL